MWILVVEAIGALGLLLFIVWWTLGPTHRRERDLLQRAAREQAVAREAAASARSASAAADRSAIEAPPRHSDPPG